MKHIVCYSLVFLVNYPVSGQSTGQHNSPIAPAHDEAPIVRFGVKWTVHSHILNEDRPCWVYLPLSYVGSVDRTYPVLYLLDGDAHFGWASEMVRFMSEINGNFQIPESIIVAIPNTRGNRTRDFTPTHSLKDSEGKDDPAQASSGGGQLFETYIKRELIPKIEAEYRTAPYRIFVGHSLGALLALDAVLRRPAVFQACIAIDPSIWWDNYVLLKTAKEVLPKATDLHQQVYVSLANNLPAEDFDPKPIANASRYYVEMLQTNAPATFRSQLDYFQSENHNSVPFFSLYHGLLFVFDGYKPPAYFENRASLQAHFKAISARLRCEFLPPEDFVNANGQYLRQVKHDAGEAVEFFKLSVKNYPNSADAYESLARVYSTQGQSLLAIRNYKRALELDPKRQSAVEALKRLK